MAQQIRRTVITIAVCCLLSAGCAGRYRGPRTLAAVGSVLIVGGGTTWIAGERSNQSGVTSIGFSLVAAGVALAIAAGGWMAATVGCDADPDCDDTETCREVPAPPGGIPYKQCVPR